MSLQESDNKKAITLLKAVLYENLSAKDALAKWPTVEKRSGKAMKNCYHQLYHYLADEDIRSKEPEYAKYQQTNLQRCLDDLLAEEKA